MLPFVFLLEKIAIQERKELICAVVAATNKSAKYEHGGTLCPVCALLQIRSVLKVITTIEEIRHCKCPVCDANIKAVGDSSKILEEVTRPPVVAYKESKSTQKKGRARGNNRRADSRPGALQSRT